MKTILLYLALFLFSSVYSQPPETVFGNHVKIHGDRKSVYRTRKTPFKTSTFIYLFNDKNKLSVFYLAGHHDEKTELVYDDKNLLEQIDFVNGRPKFKEVYIYDAKNRLVLNRTLKNDSLVGGRLYEFKNDKLIRYTQLDTIDFKYSIRYKYDDEQGITEATTFMNDTVFGIGRTKKITSNRKIVEQSLADKNDSILREVVTHLNKYGEVIWRREFEKGKEIRGRKYKYRGKRLKKVIVYNGPGRVQSKTIYDSNGNFLRELDNHSGKVTKWKNIYDDRGNLVQSIKYRDGEFIEENRYLIIYR